MTEIIKGDCIEAMKRIKDNCIDAVISDPPYNLGFMGKKWDVISNYQKSTELWATEALRVLKPGGYALVFGGTRTFHREMCGLEDAGFEIRDTIMWLYGTGFPKGHNIGKGIDKKLGKERVVIDTVTKARAKGQKMALPTMGAETKYIDLDITIPNSPESKQWEGWNTNLKPAYEPIIMCRKPFKGTVVDNVLKWGTGGINIDACRISTNDNLNGGSYDPDRTSKELLTDASSYCILPTKKEFKQPTGRYPANIILDEVSAEMLDEQSGVSMSSKNVMSDNRKNIGKSMFIDGVRNPENSYLDKGGASRFFYVAKASKSERDMGCEALEERLAPTSTWASKPFKRTSDIPKYNTGNITPPTKSHNIHPCVKPLKLIEYLIKMVSVEGAVILDPFVGSGTTCIACKKLHRKCIGIDNNAEYVEIAKSRIDSVKINKRLGDK